MDFYSFYLDIKATREGNTIALSNIKQEELDIEDETNRQSPIDDDYRDFDQSDADSFDKHFEPIDEKLVVKVEESESEMFSPMGKTKPNNLLKRSNRPKNYKKSGLIKYKTKRIHNKKYTCDLCNSQFRQYRFVKAHILQKHLNIYEDICPECGKHSYDKHSLNRHIEQVHLKTYKKKRDVCPECGKLVTYLNLHRKLVHHVGVDPNEEKKKEFYICDLCGIQYTRYPYVKKHILQKHLNLKEDKCPICFIAFYNKASVKRHMESKHRSEMGLEPKDSIPVTVCQCDVCLKVFNRKENMMRHRRTVHKEFTEMKVDNG